MNVDNKAILLKANALVTEGNNEGFLKYCTDDVLWEFVGDQTLHGKEAVREYMKATYIEPPRFDVETMIAEADYVTVIGKISLKDGSGKLVKYAYCDVWQFKEGLMSGLKAFVVEIG